MTIIDIKSAARKLGVTPMSMYRYMRYGYLSAKQLVNGMWILTEEAVNKFAVDRAAGKFPKHGPQPKMPKTEIFETFVGSKQM